MDITNLIGETTEYDKKAALEAKKPKSRLDPIPEFTLRFCEEEGKTLVVLDISKGEETPYYYSGDGVLEAYIRVGNTQRSTVKRLLLS